MHSRTIFFFCFALTLFSVQTHSQFIYNETLLIPHGFEFFPQSGHGISTISNSATEIGNMNPASLSMFDKFKFGISIKYSPIVKEAWFGKTGKEFLIKHNPQTAGIVIPYKNFRLGAAINQRYNAKVNYKTGFVYGNNTEPETYSYYDSKSEIRTYSLLASYLIKDDIKGNSLALGLKFSNNVLNDFRTNIFGYNSTSIHYSKNNFSIGIIYSNPLSGEKLFNLGLSYDSRIKFEDPYGQNIYLYELPTSTLQNPHKLGIPEKFKFELNSNYFDKFILSTGVNILGWNRIYDQVKNTVEFMANADYDALDNMKAALGIFYTNYQFNDKGASEFNNKLKALYIIGGIAYRYEFLNLNLSVADSHLLSGDWWKETIIKTSIGITI